MTFVELVASEMRKRPELLMQLLKQLRVNVTREMRNSLTEWEEHDMNMASGLADARYEEE